MADSSRYQQGQFSWVDLRAHDVVAAQDFYGQLLGWTSSQMDTEGGDPYFQFEYQGKIVAGLGEAGEEMKSAGMPSLWACYIRVDDIQAICEKAKELGGEVTMPPMQVVEYGHVAFIADPSGICVGLWQPIRFSGAELYDCVGAFCWNELATREFDKSASFFAGLFGWEYEPFPENPTRYEIIKLNGKEVGGIMQIAPEMEQMPGCWSVYFSVADCDAAAAKIKELGGQLIMEPFDIPVGRMSVAFDPQGAMFNIIKLNPMPDGEE